MKLLNRQIVNIVLTIIVLLASVLGNHTVLAGGYSGETDVTKIQVFNGGFFVQLDPNVALDPNPCPSFGGFFIFIGNDLDPSQKSLKDYYAVVLTAFTLGKKINIASNGCYGNYPRGDAIVLSK